MLPLQMSGGHTETKSISREMKLESICSRVPEAKALL